MRAAPKTEKSLEKTAPKKSPKKKSAPPGTRTPNLPIKSRMLYQLS